MAGRIRSIKPEALDDEEATGLSDEAWRLWISTWLLADDHGNLRAGDRYLAALVWQDTSRSPRVAEILRELRRTRRLEVYDNNGERYAHVRNWERHQRIDNAGKPRVPGPRHEDSLTWEESRGDSPRLAETLGKSPLDLRPPTSDHRSPTTDHRPAAMQPALILVTARTKNGKQRADCSTHPEAMGILGTLNASRLAAMPRSRELKAIPANVKLISDRLAEGHTVADCEHVIAVCAAETKRDPKCGQWLDAVTPFRPENFVRKLGQTLPAAQVAPRYAGPYKYLDDEVKP